MSLQNLYGSSHSYMQNLCDGSACNQMPLQNLWFGSHIAHDISHTVTHAADDVAHVTVKAADGTAHAAVIVAHGTKVAFNAAAPDMKWAAGETWKGVQWCMASAPCKAAAQKYGTMALEDGMKSAAALQNLWFGPKGNTPQANLNKACAEEGCLQNLYGSSHSYLQNLCDGSDCNQMGLQNLWFGSHIEHDISHAVSHAAHDVAHVAVKAADGTAHAAVIVAHGTKVAFNAAAPDMKWAAGEAWKGIKWCDQSAPCKAAVKKYGMMALKDGMKSEASLQNLWFGPKGNTPQANLNKACAEEGCLQNLYGSSHSYMLQNMYGSSHSYLQNLNFFDSLKNDAEKVIGVAKKVQSACAGNADCVALEKKGAAAAEARAKKAISLQQLYGSSHSYLQNMYGSSHSYMI